MTVAEDEPQWLREMSPRERATYVNAHSRTEEDYLTIISERPDVSFSEYENLNVLFDMIRRGLIRWRDGISSKHTSMGTALYPELTDMGRAKFISEQGQKEQQ